MLSLPSSMQSCPAAPTPARLALACPRLTLQGRGDGMSFPPASAPPASSPFPLHSLPTPRHAPRRSAVVDVTTVRPPSPPRSECRKEDPPLVFPLLSTQYRRARRPFPLISSITLHLHHHSSLLASFHRQTAHELSTTGASLVVGRELRARRGTDADEIPLPLQHDDGFKVRLVLLCRRKPEGAGWNGGRTSSTEKQG